MNPWTIIGWIILVAIIIPVALILLYLVINIARRLRHHISYLRTRNDVPEKGQKWEVDGGIFTVTVSNVSQEGVVSLKSERISFCHDRESWKEYVRSRKLRRVS